MTGVIMTAARAWVSGVATCLLVLVALVSAQQLALDRWSWHAALDMPVAFSLVFAAVSAVLYVPLFVVLVRSSWAGHTRAARIAAGVVLAPVTTLVIGAMVGERWDLGGLAAASIPFALAGAVFAIAWGRTPQH